MGVRGSHRWLTHRSGGPLLVVALAVLGIVLIAGLPAAPQAPSRTVPATMTAREFHDMLHSTGAPPAAQVMHLQSSLACGNNTTSPYRIRVTESGLPSGTTWRATVAGCEKHTTSTLNTFFVINGTYAFSIGSVSGFSASPQFGNVSVRGSNKTVAVTYTASDSTVTGLLSDWWVIAIAVVALLVIIVLVVMVMRMRKRTPPPPQAPPPEWSEPQAEPAAAAPPEAPADAPPATGEST